MFLIFASNFCTFCKVLNSFQGPLPLDVQLLGEKAINCRAYAKALHYKEDEFYKGPTSQVIESLISINNKLQQKEAAAGIHASVYESNSALNEEG